MSRLLRQWSLPVFRLCYPECSVRPGTDLERKSWKVERLCSQLPGDNAHCPTRPLGTHGAGDEAECEAQSRCLPGRKDTDCRGRQACASSLWDVRTGQSHLGQGLGRTVSPRTVYKDPRKQMRVMTIELMTPGLHMKTLFRVNTAELLPAPRAAPFLYRCHCPPPLSQEPLPSSA